MAVQTEQQAELEFAGYNWDADPKWKEKLAQVFISDAADKTLAEMRLKRKFFKAHINSNLSLDPPKNQPTPCSVDNEQVTSAGFDFKRRLCISINYVCLFLHTVNVLSVIGYQFSFSSVQMAYSCFRASMLCSIIASLLQIGVKYGRPKMDLVYAQLVLADEQSHYVLMYFSMLFAHPIFLATVPVFARSVLFLSLCLDTAILPMFFPQYHRKISSYLTLIRDLESRLTDWLSQLDIALGFVLLFSLLTSARQPMVTLLYWQYLRIRYMFSSSGKAAFQNTRHSLDSYLLHPRSPALVQSVYRKVQDFAYSTVDPEQARARHDQLQNSKCQIM